MAKKMDSRRGGREVELKVAVRQPTSSGRMLDMQVIPIITRARFPHLEILIAAVRTGAETETSLAQRMPVAS
jgi:hypothetical protein